MTHTELLTIETPGRDEQRIQMYTDACLVAIEIDDDETGACIELSLSESQVEALVAKLAVTLAMKRLAG